MNIKERYKLWSGFCDKQYRVGYIPPESLNNDDIKFIRGEMLNYNGGNVILANDDGIWHIPYSAIKWILPIKNKEN